MNTNSSSKDFQFSGKGSDNELCKLKGFARTLDSIMGLMLVSSGITEAQEVSSGDGGIKSQLFLSGVSVCCWWLELKTKERHQQHDYYIVNYFVSAKFQTRV